MKLDQSLIKNFETDNQSAKGLDFPSLSPASRLTHHDACFLRAVVASHLFLTQFGLLSLSLCLFLSSATSCGKGAVSRRVFRFTSFQTDHNSPEWYSLFLSLRFGQYYNLDHVHNYRVQTFPHQSSFNWTGWKPELSLSPGSRNGL